ncbi:MAG: sulfite exporter TauE/SafE family protein [Gemmatimonadales bacterium]
MIALGYSLALVIGLSLGLLGGGGSILTVPVLHYVLGYDVKVAVPMSLVVVGLTSAAGSIAHWRAGTLHARTALAFGPPAVLGALLGAELGLQATPSLQLTVFALAMLAAAVAMYFGPALSALSPRPPSDGGAPAGQEGSRRLPLVPLVGALVGLLTGFVGVGGGFLYVPALIALGGLAVKEAIGTSLVLIMLSCIAAVARYHGNTQMDWRTIAIFCALAFLGVGVGSRLSPHVPNHVLRRGFAVLLFVMGALVLLRGR